MEEAPITFQEDLAENVKGDIGKDMEDIEVLVAVLVTSNIGDSKEGITMEVLVVRGIIKEVSEVVIIMGLKWDIKEFKEEALAMVLIKVDSVIALEVIGDMPND